MDQAAPAAPSAPPPPADKERRRQQVLQRVFVGELVAAIEASRIFEHLARAMLAVAVWLSRVEEREYAHHHRDTVTPHSASVTFMLGAHTHLGLLARLLSQAPAELGGPGAAARLRSAVLGPCMQHLMMSAGLAALCAADSGPPADVLPYRGCLPVPGKMYLELEGQVPDVCTAGGRQAVLTEVVQALVDCPCCPRADGPSLRPLHAATLLLRVARWAVESGRVWAEASAEEAEQASEEEEEEEPASQEEEEEEPASQEEEEEEPASEEEEEAEGRRPVGPRRPPASSSEVLVVEPEPEAGQGADEDRGGEEDEEEEEGDTPPSQVLVDTAQVVSTAVRSLARVDKLLAAEAPGSAAVQQAAAERWRVAVGAALHASRCAADQEGIKALGDLFDPLIQGREMRADGSLPPEPPPALVSALAGGIVRGVEGLLRAAGREGFAGAAAALAADLFGPERHPGVLLRRLLAYGPADEAAALVVTIGKVLRTAEAEVAERTDTRAFQNLLFISAPLFRVHPDVEENDLQKRLTPGTGAADRQLSLMLMRSAVEWVPVMSRLAQVTTAQVFEGRLGTRSDTMTWFPKVMWYAAGPLAWFRLIPSLLELGRSSKGPSGSGSRAGSTASVPGPSTAAAAAAAGPSTSSSAAAGGAAAGGGYAALAALLLREAVPTIGALLRLTELWSPGASSAGPEPERMRMHAAAFVMQVFDVASALAVVAPEEVRRAAQESAASKRKGAASEPAAAVAGGWRSQVVTGLMSKLRATKLSATKLMNSNYEQELKALAALLSNWARGEEGSAELAALARHAVLDHDRLAVRRLPPPESALSLLPACANPGCTRLDGDSEADLPLPLSAGGGAGVARRFCSEPCRSLACGGDGAGRGAGA